MRRLLACDSSAPADARHLLRTGGHEPQAGTLVVLVPDLLPARWGAQHDSRFQKQQPLPAVRARVAGCCLLRRRTGQVVPSKLPRTGRRWALRFSATCPIPLAAAGDRVLELSSMAKSCQVLAMRRGWLAARARSAVRRAGLVNRSRAPGCPSRARVSLPRVCQARAAVPRSCWARPLEVRRPWGQKTVRAATARWSPLKRDSSAVDVLPLPQATMTLRLSRESGAAVLCRSPTHPGGAWGTPGRAGAVTRGNCRCSPQPRAARALSLGIRAKEASAADARCAGESPGAGSPVAAVWQFPHRPRRRVADGAGLRAEPAMMPGTPDPSGARAPVRPARVHDR